MEHSGERVDLESSEQESLDRFVELVRSSPHNLMSPRALEEIWERHVPECVHLARRLPRDATVLDLGSGGGFPGVVVAVVRPDLEVTLLEATEKKARFLERVVDELGLDAAVVNRRAERATGQRARYDVVMARAVADLATLLRWSVPLLVPGGELWAVKGRRWPEELEDAQSAMEELGCRVVATPDPGIGDDDMEPRVVIIARPRRCAEKV